MRLFRKKKKDTPRKSKPASIYYSPAAASTPTALRSEEAAVARTPQERALADFAGGAPPAEFAAETPEEIHSGKVDDGPGNFLKKFAVVDFEGCRQSVATLRSGERKAATTPRHSRDAEQCHCKAGKDMLSGQLPSVEPPTPGRQSIRPWTAMLQV